MSYTRLTCLLLCRADLFKQQVWDSYVELAAMPPLGPMLSLYQELKASNWSFAIISERAEWQRNVTVLNLDNVGYEDYILILRLVRFSQNSAADFTSSCDHGFFTFGVIRARTCGLM